MDCLDALMTRRSIRRYTDEPVSEADLEILLRAAMAAPSAGNQQSWRIVVVTDRGQLERLSKATPYSQMLAASAPSASWCAATRATSAHVGYWVQDCSAAIQNLLVAANAIGLGARVDRLLPRRRARLQRARDLRRARGRGPDVDDRRRPPAEDEARRRSLRARVRPPRSLGGLGRCRSPLLEARDLVLRFPVTPGRSHVLDGVSLTVAGGEVVDVVGPSGSGKSTLLRSLARLLPGVRGVLLLDGEPAESIEPHAWRSRVALLPQKAAIVPGTMRDNLLLPWQLKVRGPAPPRRVMSYCAPRSTG